MKGRERDGGRVVLSGIEKAKTMSLDRVRDYCTQTLCSHRGSLDYYSLRREVFGYFKVPDGELRRVLADGQLFTKVPPDDERLQLSDGTLLIATTPARLCKDFLKKDCSSGACDQLHLCKFFLYDNCKFAKGRITCNSSHDIHSPHNFPILRSNNLQHLNVMQLRQILLQNDASLLPEICVFYNKGRGQFGSCTFKDQCTRLHVCLHFVQGTCKFGAHCKRSHYFQDNSTSSILDNLSMELIKCMPQIYQNLYNIKNYKASKGEASEKSQHSMTAALAGRRSQSRLSSSNSSDDAASEEICLYFVWKNCSFKDKCMRVHCKLPYQWQICDELWRDLPNMEQIEKDYCDPNKTRSLNVNFESMMCGLSPVRRLSTASSVKKPPHYILTTTWLWFWKDEFGKWIEYGMQEEGHSAANITSTELEKAFLADNGKVEFTAGKHKYQLNFKAMQQTNTHIGSHREVRRRPKFISEQDTKSQIQNQGKAGHESLGITQGKSLPAHWDKSALPEVSYKLVQVLESSDEYKQVQSLFQRTMKKSVIRKIERIQNPALWEVYEWQMDQMKKNNNGKDVVEKQLFHGTNPSIIDAICQQNFDWRICGTHGTSYGKGSYFARDSSYSHNYCQTGKTIMTMFVARVLVGEFVRGSSSYLRPPLRDGTKNNFYNSCVDNVSNPSIFVIFEKHQIYPEYLIEYKC
ncbi:protein mono-ADP-ribosyltransferase PARP12-like [Leucoraja erinacea]|uniref:protein mono-ADP-ribosyltransferase PARP12-like n=1 Tax=Leucoraja erinaceus TaxID=7782 RepID=UPI002455CEFA|nr:protein mono-ADP-ribosyltransferase PARP12-like [Leucoraja erinacea]